MKTLHQIIGDAIALALVSILILACAVLAFGQPIAITPPVATTPPHPPISQFPDYDTARQQAAVGGKPLVVFVATKPRQVPGTLASFTSRLKGVEGPTVVVARPYGAGRLEWVATLPANATDAQIRAALGLEASRAATFFRRPGEARRTADDSKKVAGPWPKSLPFWKGMQRFFPSRNTQEIAVTNNRDRITPIPRLNREPKWLVPGGMVGVDGWRSDLYRFVPAEPRTWVGNIPVWNGFNHQNNRGWLREYADGTFFVDVLSVDDRVFEVRVAEKTDGRWTHYVAFKDVASRPDGYVGLNQSCVSCHAEAGHGNYAAPLVPGGDFVLSDPFQELER